MLFLKHNPSYNYMTAIKSKDESYTEDLLLNDISDVIVTRKNIVLAALKNARVPVKGDESEEQIVVLISDNLPVNKKLATNLARVIADNEKMKKIQPKHYNMNMGEWLKYANPNAGADVAKDAGTVASSMAQPSSGNVVGAIANALTAGFGVVSNRQQRNIKKEETKQKLIDLVSLKRMRGAASEMSRTTKIVLISGTVVLLGIITYLIIRKK